MSENISHTAIASDCFRLTLASAEICDAFKDALRLHPSFACLGAVTWAGDSFTVGLLSDLRNRWALQTPDERLEPKLGFLLGWLTHRAADRHMKPVFRELDPPEERVHYPSEPSVYHDAFAFNFLFDGGREAPYHPAMFEPGLASLPASGLFDLPLLETFFRSCLKRTLAALHPFRPDLESLEGWLDRLLVVQQRFRVDLERYTAAIHNPDPDKVRRFYQETNLYDAQDPVIHVAQRLKQGEHVSSVEVAEAVSAEAVSHYGSALKGGVAYILEANAFFTSNMSPETLKDRLEIDKLGRDGKPV